MTPERLPSGLLIGHADDPDGLTGCTALIFDKTVIGAAEIAGSAPATSNFSALNPVHVFPRIDGIFLTGGSVFGLNAVGGMQRFLEEHGRGFDVGVAKIPIVPAAGIFDLAIGNPKVRPTESMGYQACRNAADSLPKMGSAGAAMGASVGKFFGIKQAMRGGFGLSCRTSQAGAQVWAFAVVNAFGDIVQPRSPEIIAGARKSATSLEFADANKHIAAGWKRTGYGIRAHAEPAGSSSEHGWTKVSQDPDNEPPVDNTTLITIVTTAALDVLDARKIAQSAILGLADTVRPACTIFDGDLAIAASIGSVKEDITALCVLAREATAESIVNGVREASGLEGLPSVNSRTSELE
jgi:L-aminopeptidase/D-esterase-like protein